MNVKINKLSEKSVQIEIYENNVLKSDMIYPAKFYAKANRGLTMIYITTKEMPFDDIFVSPEELEIDGVVQTDVQEATKTLNSFIGNFNIGGASSATTEQIREEVENQLENTDINLDTF
jgi:leucyl aminopeptidase (aminopeptidase T)